MIAADPIRLEQIVINLMTNANKYTPVGGQISLTVEPTADDAIISVRDSGEGIPPEMLDLVFEPFVQVHRAGARPGIGGLGVGLAVAKRLVEQHGGAIEARSAGLGHGSEFIVRLALTAESVTGVTQTAPAPPTAPARILVVEDDPDTREMLRLGLELAGHRVTVAGTGDEAIDRAAEILPEVMLIDLGPPDVEGHQVVCRMRAAFGDAIFLIALTGYGGAENLRKSEAAGFDAHVLKPATVEELTRLLARRGRREQPRRDYR